ncbi:MAG: hypothetical protein FWG32_09775 [Oscillospiraceae bacterium]|nr:hypothetical protein [Oscillospiraceae bacterium]
MATKCRRVTFVITPDMEPIMDRAKKKFYDRTMSEMIRILLLAGLDSLDVDISESEQLKEIKTVTD